MEEVFTLHLPVPKNKLGEVMSSSSPMLKTIDLPQIHRKFHGIFFFSRSPFSESRKFDKY